jgi:GNAT superfamily N-acetyltransferase
VLIVGCEWGIVKRGLLRLPCAIRDDRSVAAESIIPAFEETKTFGSIQIRPLSQHDPPVIAGAFASIGWVKPEAKYRLYLEEEEAGTRTCLVATVDGEFAGYVTVNWRPTYRGFAELEIPEIQDLNVLPAFRRRGIASRLLDLAEGRAARRCSVVGVGVGLHAGYNAAQRLYGLRGYIPDGRGVTYRDQYVGQYVQVMLDDDLVMHLTKDLRTKKETQL